ncbi:hypothetical protein LDB30_06615 [Acidithiobacillus ferrooxidans]|nr:hypothetical protein LDB30_06615 [Acidithiobacillus ferrooxidans]
MTHLPRRLSVRITYYLDAVTDLQKRGFLWSEVAQMLFETGALDYTPGAEYLSRTVHAARKRIASGEIAPKQYPILLHVRKKPVVNEKGAAIIHALVQDFGKIVAYCETVTGLHWSRQQLREMLGRYRGERGYLYVHANVHNVPWMFLYFSNAVLLSAASILDRRIMDAIVAQVPDVSLDEDERLRSIGNRPVASVSFIHYRSEDETIRMVISETDSQRRIFEKMITFDVLAYQHFPAESRSEYTELAFSVLGKSLPKH